MEAEFSERLKRYRKEKNMTQQELADALGVSNKSISRWESAGGYPDVPLLVPLARALGVSVDDLLDGEKPVRALTRTDVQSLLSFAFALGGGILFYLLRLFVPLLVCYLAYLGCMAYGVYLQRYYAYHSRWFWLGNAGMNLAVNLSVIAGAAAGGLVLVAGGGSTLLSTWFQLWLSGRQRGMVLGVLFLWLALGAALTALTMGLARRHFQEKGGFRLSVWSLPRGRALLPAAGFLVVLGFWGAYCLDILPIWCYRYQGGLFAGLLVLLELWYLWLFRRDRRRLVPALLMTALCGPMWLFAKGSAEQIWSLSTGREYSWTPEVDLSRFIVEWRPSAVVFLLGVILLVLYLVLAGCSVRKKQPEEDTI